MKPAICGKGEAQDNHLSYFDCHMNEYDTRFGDVHHARSAQQTSSDSVSFVSTFSTNYTMSNLVGTGRILGNLYSAAGRRLEKALGVVAGKVGYGPEAAYRRLQSQCCQSPKLLNAKRRIDIQKSYGRLLRYASSDMLQTRLLAIERLTEFFNSLFNNGRFILIEGPYFESRIRLILQEIEITPISRFPDSYRKTLANAIAMFSVMASSHGLELERIHKSLMHLYWWDGIDQRESAWINLCMELFNYLKSGALHVRLSAIEKLSQFFADRRMIGWFLASDFANSRQCFLALNLTIDGLMVLEMSDRHKRVLELARSQFSSSQLSIHVAGVTLISPRNERLFLSDRRLRRITRKTSALSFEQEFSWKRSFRHLLSGIRNAECSSLSVWYLESWASQLMNGDFNFDLALELSKALRELMASEILLVVDKNDLASISYVIHKQLVSRVQCEGEASVTGTTYTVPNTVNECNALMKACKLYLQQHVEPRSDLHLKLSTMEEI